MTLRSNTLFGGENKVQIAIERIMAHCPPEGYILAFSGGKDSCVCNDLLRQSGVPYRKIYNVVPVDPPELIRFIREYHPDAERKRPKRSLIAGVRSHGLPTRFRRWCCEEWKHGRNEDGIYVLGVRWAESVKRKTSWRMFQHCAKVDSFTLCPIIDWTDAEIWQYIRERQIPYCSLYDKGFDRLGCVMCPLVNSPGNTSRLEADMARWPKIARAWRRGADAQFEYLLERDGENRYHKTADELWTWWISGCPGRDHDALLDFEEESEE